MTAATTLGRLALGEATQITDDKGELMQQPDYSNLTDHEIEVLDNIGEKLYGG